MTTSRENNLVMIHIHKYIGTVNWVDSNKIDSIIVSAELALDTFISVYNNVIASLWCDVCCLIIDWKHKWYVASRPWIFTTTCDLLSCVMLHLHGSQKPHSLSDGRIKTQPVTDTKDLSSAIENDNNIWDKNISYSVFWQILGQL